MRAALSVSELNEYARLLLSQDEVLRDVSVTGEISGYTRAYSGHRYFSLKDKDAKIDCAMWRANAMQLDFEPQNGQRVTVRGSVSIYPREGRYQLYVSFMQKTGIGDLYVCYEQMKNRLAAEGLFDPARKQQIPLFPRKLGLVTSETGAAVRDMIRVARRRNPNIEIVLAPCSVQGESAVPEIIHAIRLLNDRTDCDVLLVGRGGGSIEDLWAFNEEAVARAIADSRIPVISCVGHEIDFTIADFVADLRAATPSHAAELAVPVLEDHRADLKGLSDRLDQALLRGQDARRAELERVTSSMMLRCPSETLIVPHRNRLTNLAVRLSSAYIHRIDLCRHQLATTAAMLRTLDPEAVMARGYAIVRDADGKVCTGVADMQSGHSLHLSMKDGTAEVTIVKVEEER